MKDGSLKQDIPLLGVTNENFIPQYQMDGKSL